MQRFASTLVFAYYYDSYIHRSSKKGTKNTIKGVNYPDLLNNQKLVMTCDVCSIAVLKFGMDLVIHIHSCIIVHHTRAFSVYISIILPASSHNINTKKCCEKEETYFLTTNTTNSSIHNERITRT